MICGFRSQIWSTNPHLIEGSINSPQHIIPYPECPGCEKHRAFLKGDYLCVQCRYPLVRYTDGLFVGWTGPGCPLKKAAHDSLPKGIHDELMELE